MHPVKILAMAVLIFAAAGWAQTPPPEPEVAPDPAVVRGRVDGLIRSFTEQHKKATLGMIQQAIALSISYGAPAYNLGDRAGCFHFYATTADALVAAFPDEASATEMARRSLLDLKSARDRTRRNTNLDHNAWSMRYAFDKTQIAYEMKVESTSAMIQLGTENYRISQFQEAQDAYETAARSLAEFDGLPPEQIPFACRCAPLALGNALFAQKKYKEASEAIVAGLHYVPMWPSLTLDLRALHHDPAQYEDLMADLQAKAKASPNDAPLQFLLGYELYFTGKKASARQQFEQTLKADPEHAGAKLFLGYKPPVEGKPDEPPEQPFTPRQPGGAFKA